MPEPGAKRLIEKLGKHDLMRLITPHKIWVANIRQRGFPDVYIASRSNPGVYKEIASYCRMKTDIRERELYPADMPNRYLVYRFFSRPARVPRGPWLKIHEVGLDDSLSPIVWVAAIVDFNSGTTILLSSTEPRLREKVALWARDNWGGSLDGQPPADSEDVIAEFFGQAGEMHLNIKAVPLHA